MNEIPRSILVVEDEDFLREGIAALLAHAGWEVVQARDGREGLRAFRDRPIEVVLTDLLMPHIDGMQLLAAIREIDPEVPVLILTGYGTIERCVAALRSGATDFLAKPFENDQLLAALDAAWRSRIRASPSEKILSESECRFRTKIPSDLAQVPPVVAEIEAVARALGFYGLRWSIRRACQEAIANAVRHGSNGHGGEITIEAVFDGTSGVVRVQDTGPGFDAKILDRDPQGGSEGRGLFLIRSFADEARWLPPGNQVEMVFHRRGGPGRG